MQAHFVFRDKTLYIAKYFKPEAKARMDALVTNIINAYRVGIDSLGSPK